MAEVTSTSLNYTNYRINKKGLYESSPTAKEGFVEVIYGDKKDKVTYHRYVEGIIGKISSLRVTEPPYGGKFLTLVMVDGSDAYSISTKLYGDNGNYGFVARLMLDSLAKVDFTKEVLVSFYTKKVEDAEYQNMSVSYPGEKTEDGKKVYAPRIMKDDKPVREYKKVGGENVLIVDTEVNFYFDILEEIKKTLMNKPTDTNVSESSVPKAKLEPAGNTFEEEDDLPF